MHISANVELRVELGYRWLGEETSTSSGNRSSDNLWVLGHQLTLASWIRASSNFMILQHHFCVHPLFCTALHLHWSYTGLALMEFISAFYKWYCILHFGQMHQQYVWQTLLNYCTMPCGLLLHKLTNTDLYIIHLLDLKQTKMDGLQRSQGLANWNYLCDHGNLLKSNCRTWQVSRRL